MNFRLLTLFLELYIVRESLLLKEVKIYNAITNHLLPSSDSNPRLVKNQNHPLYFPHVPMDSMIHSALEEICAVGANGLTLSNLWLKLKPTLTCHGLEPCVGVKEALWTNLLNVPALGFESRKGASYDSRDSAIQLVENCDKLGIKIVAAQHLRNSFVGLYDVDASRDGISVQGRRVLERLAIARFVVLRSNGF